MIPNIIMSIVLITATLISSQTMMCQTSQWLAPTTADDLKNPLILDEQSAATGQQLFSTICFVCHGNQGKGDGINAASLTKPPADLTSQKVQRQSDGALFWKISEGNPPILTFKESLTEEQRWSLVNYVRKLAKKNPSPTIVATKDQLPPSSKVTSTGIVISTTAIIKGSKLVEKNTSNKVKVSGSNSNSVVSGDIIPFEGVMDGKFLFRNICGACHAIGKGKMIGPDLKDVSTRHEREWLYKWIRSSQTMIKEGDSKAVRLFAENNRTIMTDHKYLTKEQIENILNYVDTESANLIASARLKAAPSKISNTRVEVVHSSVYPKMLTYFMYAGFAYVMFSFLYASIVLTRIIKEG